jgi:hypothetical protein
MANKLRHRREYCRSGFAMIHDMALLKQAMEQMDAEDPTVAQAAKDRTAQVLSEANLNFAKMAEMIEQRRLLLRPRIIAGIKRMDQPGMLGDAAFRDAGSALRREGQSFRQIAEAIEQHSAGPEPRYEDPVRMDIGPRTMAGEPVMPPGFSEPAWLRALFFVAGIVLFPLRHPIRFLMLAVLAILLFYALRGFVGLGQQASAYFDGVGAVRHGADRAISSVSSFVNEIIFRHPQNPSNENPSNKDPSNKDPSSAAPSKEAEAPPRPPLPIPSASSAAASPPAATPPATTPPSGPGTASSQPPPTTPAPSGNVSVAPPPPAAAPAPPLAPPVAPRISTPRRDARGSFPSRLAENCAAPEDRYSRPRGRAPLLEERSRALDDLIPEGTARNSRTAGPCFGGVGGCSWGGGQY